MREQSGHIFKASGAWYLKYRTDVIEDGKVNRVLKTHRLADLDDRCRTISDAKKMAKEFLKPFNEGKISAQSSVSLTDFVENTWLPWIRSQVRAASEDSNRRTWSRRVIAPALKAVGIDWCGYYSLRRGAGTMATMVARDRGLAAKGLLRHRTLSTTSQFYIDSVPSETREAVEEMGRLFQKCSKESVALAVSATKQR